MDIDRQRIAAVRALEALGFIYRNGTWMPPGPAPVRVLPLTAEADAMHAALVQRADALAGCRKGSDEEAELRVITDLIEAYEAKRWPLGKASGGKG
jgi:hypothetical protein